MLRSFLYEFGHTVPQGVHRLGQIEAIIVEPHSDLPEAVRTECQEVLDQIAGLTARITVSDMRIKRRAAETDTARRLQTMPGIGPLTRTCSRGLRPTDGEL